MAAADDFRALDLRCHTLLHDVPLHDVWEIALAGGGAGRTMQDALRVAAPGQTRPRSLAVRALFTLRVALGRAFRWDVPRPDALAESYVHRLADEDRVRSLVTPGTARGPFRTVYLFEHEALLEARNATVHAFLAMALRPAIDGYTLYWAVYVKPVGRLTAIYMAVIDPFRRFIVYPRLIRERQAAWARAYGAARMPPPE
jgi:hypothetical protein